MPDRISIPDDAVNMGDTRVQINELKSKAPVQPTDRVPFKVSGLYDDIPGNRAVVHRQSITIMARIIFEVELSYHHLKFYIIVKRKVSRVPIVFEGHELSDKQRKDSKEAVQ